MGRHSNIPATFETPKNLKRRKKMKTMKQITAVVLACALLSPTAAAEGGLDEIIERGKIAIAVPLDFAPFGSAGPDLQPQGYDIDMARLIAENLEVDLELVPVTTTNRIPYLQTGKVDLVISCMGASPKRAKVVWFSAAYAPFFSGVFAPEEVQISDYADLAGKTIGVTRGALEDLELTRRAPEDANIRRFEDNATTIASYLSGQVDVLVTGNTAAAQITKDNPDKSLKTKIVIKLSPCFVGMRKGESDLLHWVNVFILHKKLGGELDEMSVRWFGEPLPELPTF